MKQFIKKTCMAIAMLFTYFSASAYDFEVDGIYYSVVSLQDLTCTVVSGDEKYSGDIEIPSTVTYNNRQLTVTYIEAGAFYDCEALTSVIIPNSVTEIGERAFQRCQSLSSIDIPNSITEIGEYTFHYCRSLTSVTIPNSVTEIGESAFQSCQSLSSIDIPNSITEISEYTFSGCSSLISMTIPDSVTSIGRYAFEGCSSLISMTIPDSVTSIGSLAFSGCSSLISMTIPDSVTSIGSLAFSGCSSLISMTIPDSVTSVGSDAFQDCQSLENITLSEQLTELEQGLFYGCKSLKSITIPGSVEYINWSSVYYSKYRYIFGYCENLKEMNFLFGDSNLDVEDLYLSYYYNNYGQLIGNPLLIEHLYIDRDVIIYMSCEKALSNVKYLTYGPHSSEFDCYGGKNFENLEELTCYSIEPPKIGDFTNIQYMNLTVRVPNDVLEAYQQADVWKNFWNLEGFEYDSVEHITSETAQKSVIGRYDMNGRIVSENYQGLVIVRFSDGSTKKYLQ